MGSHYCTWEWCFIMDRVTRFKINAVYKKIANPYLNKWAKKVEDVASSQIFKIPEGDKDLRCGGTWFPGVNFLNNKINGDVDGASFRI